MKNKEVYLLVDFHIHTNYSDGKLSVDETMRVAYENKLSKIAITDHDSVLAIPRAQELALQYGIDFVPGIELSSRNDNGKINFPLDISIHILGYKINHKNTKLLEILKSYHSERKIILDNLIQKLNRNGLEIVYEDIYVIAGTQMRVQDIINHINTFFLDHKQKDYYISTAQSYYREISLIDFKVRDAIDLIKYSGGVSVWAHPFSSYKDYEIQLNSKEKILTILDKMCVLGLDGIEAMYLQYTDEQVTYLEKLAKERGLFITIGSDFHGKPPRNKMCSFETKKINPFLEALEVKCKGR